jgi:hypothetical protein
VDKFSPRPRICRRFAEIDSLKNGAIEKRIVDAGSPETNVATTLIASSRKIAMTKTDSNYFIETEDHYRDVRRTPLFAYLHDGVKWAEEIGIPD